MWWWCSESGDGFRRGSKHGHGQFIGTVGRGRNGKPIGTIGGCSVAGNECHGARSIAGICGADVILRFAAFLLAPRVGRHCPVPWLHSWRSSAEWNPGGTARNRHTRNDCHDRLHCLLHHLHPRHHTLGGNVLHFFSSLSGGLSADWHLRRTTVCHVPPVKPSS